MRNLRVRTDPIARLKSAPALTPAGRAGRQHAGLRVLLVEDNEDHVILARRALESRGHSVTAMVGGRAAMTALAEDEYDAVALDYQLPDTTGLEALGQIKKRNRVLPVVMVTAWGSEQVAVEALKKGAADYVVKTPGYERELARAIELSAQKARADAAEAALRAELERRAKTDSLTGLLNRGEMERMLKREIQPARRRHRMFAFVLIDVDDFKAINDTHGHSAGDAVLSHIARILQESIRSSDSAARWGGDEFAVLLPGASVAGAHAFVNRLSCLVYRSHTGSSGESLPPVTLSVGIACVPDRVSNAAAVLKWADRGLYAAKISGHGQAKVLVLGEGKEATPQMDQSVSLACAEGEK